MNFFGLPIKSILWMTWWNFSVPLRNNNAEDNTFNNFHCSIFLCSSFVFEFLVEFYRLLSKRGKKGKTSASCCFFCFYQTILIKSMKLPTAVRLFKGAYCACVDVALERRGEITRERYDIALGKMVLMKSD